MPHVSIEFSDGLEQNYDIQLLCKNAFAALADQPDFPNPAAIKIRAQPVSIFVWGPVFRHSHMRHYRCCRGVMNQRANV